MKVSLDWLRDYVEINESVESLEAILTQAGFPVEEVRRVGEDWMFDVEVTSNRSDCLGHIGVAREIAAVTGARLTWPEVALTETGEPVDQRVTVEDQAPDLCHRYTARLIDGVVVGPSPEWMARRLETVGVRSVSNIVDVTNYVMLEVGQPLHAFDFEKVGGGTIIVRRARKGETLETIDHSNVTLTDEMLVIADAERPVALAGIMGGAASEVSDATKQILLESAHFAPLCIRKTARELTLSSESSFRFERTVDSILTEWGSRRAAQLMVEVAGGRVAPGMVDAWPVSRASRPELTLRLSRLEQLCGLRVPEARVITILTSLGFAPSKQGEDTVRCTVPSWREHDVTREVDLIEEVLRIHGYDAVPTRGKIAITVTSPDDHQRTRASVTQALNGCGYYEAINVGFVADEHLALFTEGERFSPVRVKDTSRKDQNALRHSLLPSLLACRVHNQNAGNDRCDLYELAATHSPAEARGELPRETVRLGMVTDGDYRDLRGHVEAVVHSLSRQAEVVCEPAERSWAEAGAAATIHLRGEDGGHGPAIGVIGQPSQRLLERFGLAQPVMMAELVFESLVALQGTPFTMQPLMRFPGIVRDLSIVLAEDVPWQDVAGTISGEGIEDLQRVDFVDIYRGKGIPASTKSLTLSMEFRRPEETLTHEQVDAYQQQIVSRLTERFNATLRA